MFSILHTSDIHLAEPSQDQEDMSNGLMRCIRYIAETQIPEDAPLRMFSVDGDLFEALLSLNGKTWVHTYKFLSWLLKYADEMGWILRFMRGTFEHDRNQVGWLMDLHKSLDLKNDIRYVDTIELEYIEAIDLRILYLPDNLPYASADAILEVVHEKLRERGWDYVDYAHIHGFFTFTCPEVARAKQKIVYRPDQFPFVRKFCCVGHVHRHAADGNVISNGNPDRLGHGEEEAKGMVLVTDKGETATAKFIENPYTSPYNTLSFSEVDTTEDIVMSIRSFLKGLKTDRLIHLRVLLPNTEKMSAIRKYMSLHYAHIRLSVEKTASAKKQPLGNISTPTVVRQARGSAPTPATIEDYLLNHLGSDVITKEQIAWALAPPKKL